MINHGKARGLVERDPKTPVRITALAVVMAMALAVLGGGALLTSAQGTTPTPGAGAANTPATAILQIEELDIFFKPNLATIPADTPVQITITNNGAVGHNFAITDHRNAGLHNLNVSIDTAPGQTSTATITAPEGVYYFYCDVPGHEQAGMFGYLTVKKDASITSSEATVTPRAG